METVQYIVYVGRTYQIEWYYKQDKTMPAYEFYCSMLESDKARFMVLVQHLANAARGTFLPKKHYNIEDSKYGIYAFKPHAKRFLNFMTSESKIIITNGFQKQSQKIREKERSEIRKSILYKQDYELRIKRGDYYKTK